jgi:uncharacterized membrane protein
MQENLTPDPVNEELQDDLAGIRAWRNVFIGAAVLLPLGYLLWQWAGSLGWQSHVLDWLHLLVRWTHVILGVAWIGASFYFIFLENSLNRTHNLRDELAGNLWAIHGGGFYYVEKYKNAPGKLPEKLHWFKYEAYFTWLTGMLLLTIVYYFNAKAFMVDPAVRDISPGSAVGIGLGSLLTGWLVYDSLCRTALIHRKKTFAFIGFLIVVVFAWILSRYLSGRAAFMHVGALLGTIMAGNVFFVIIPSQKALVAAARRGKTPDPELGKYAGLRSLHNNYITLPVIYVMISNHFPVTYGGPWNWAILAVLTLGSVAVRHYINLHEKGVSAPYLLGLGAVALFALVLVTAPRPLQPGGAPVSFNDVAPIFRQRCVTCHSSHPTDDVQKVAPNGVMFDTPEQIRKMSDRILVRAVQTRTMPQANKTGITEEERQRIGDWIAQGAPID